MSDDIFSYRRYPSCGQGNCRRAPAHDYNPTGRCDEHLADYAALCKAKPGAPPMLAMDFGEGPWFTRPR